MTRASPASPGLLANRTSENTVLENGRDANEPRASWEMCRLKATRRIKGDLDMGRFATPRRRSTFVGQTNAGPAKRTSGTAKPSRVMTEDEAAEQFSSLVIPYSKGDLAQASGRTKEAAKHWKDGTRAPNSSSLITLGRSIPKIRDWVVAQMDAEIDTPPSAAETSNAATMAVLQIAATLPGEAGAIARAALSALQRGDN